MVCHVARDRDNAPQILEQQSAFPRVRGVRHKPRAAPAPDAVQKDAKGSIGDPAWRRGFVLLARHGLSFDLQTPWWHLSDAAELNVRYPDFFIILNHTGLPRDRSAG